MLLAMAAPKKPKRLCDKVVRFPRILENENFEVDSLEEYSDSDELKVSLELIRSNIYFSAFHVI